MYSDIREAWYIVSCETGDMVLEFFGSSYSNSSGTKTSGVEYVDLEPSCVVAHHYDGKTERHELPPRVDIAPDGATITLTWRDGRTETRKRRGTWITIRNAGRLQLRPMVNDPATASKPTTSTPDPVRTTWTRIEAWLAREHPSGAQILAPGASDAGLAQLAADFGTLPKELEALLRVHDGQASHDRFVHSCAYECGGGTFELLSIAGMLAEWRLRNDSLKISDEENASLGGEASGVKPLYWNRTGWLPLALGDQGDCFFVDLDPPPTGTVGQVFVWYRDEGPASVVAPNVGAWLGTLADCMDSGKMFVEGDQVMHEDE